MACFSAAMPATDYPHHLWLVLIPLSWLLSSLALHELLTAWATVTLHPATPAGVICLVALLHTLDIQQTGIQQANYYLYAIQRSSTGSYAQPDDRLVVWGWQNRYHVDTQLPQGTSENTSFRSMYEHSLRQAYREKYVYDIQRSQPIFFLDATGPNSLFMSDRGRYRFENFPPLADYIAHHYTLLGAVDHVRIYLRNDRAVGRQLSWRKNQP
jgi:hypothetical protein